MNVTKDAQPARKILDRQIRINKAEPTKCDFCGSTDTLYLINYSDRQKDSHWANPTAHTPGLRGVMMRACKDHPYEVIAMLLTKEGIPQPQEFALGEKETLPDIDIDMDCAYKRAMEGSADPHILTTAIPNLGAVTITQGNTVSGIAFSRVTIDGREATTEERTAIQQWFLTQEKISK